MGKKLEAWVVVLAWVYCTWLFVWLGTYLLSGDRFWWGALWHALAHHFFWPLPLVIVLAAITRRRSLWLGSGAALVVWAALFGRLFTPAIPAVHAAEASFRVMTYNVEYRNRDVEAVVNTIRTARADVVGIQELTPELAASLTRELAGEYPYQVLNPRESVIGMGLFSRYPLEVQDSGGVLAGSWIGEPQAVRVALPGGPVEVLNVHFTQGPNRNANASQVAAWAAAQSESVIVLGDLNATSLSEAYKTLAHAGLRDAWDAMGWGYGSTFPATGRLAAGTRTLYFPGPLVRIDYIFYSPDLAAQSVERLAWDDWSDHLAVVAALSRSGR